MLDIAVDPLEHSHFYDFYDLHDIGSSSTVCRQPDLPNRVRPC